MLAWMVACFFSTGNTWAQDGIHLLDMPKQRKPINEPDVKQPLTIIFVCDRSGSMEDDGKIDELNNALGTFFKDLQDKSTLANNLHIGVVDFASGVNISRAPKPLGLRPSAPRFRADGGTNMSDALKVAYKLAKKVPAGQLKPIIMLLTDGEPDSKGRTRQEAKYASQAAHLYTLGVSGADFDFLEEIASDPSQTATLKGTQFQSFFKDMSDALNYHIMSAQKNGTAPRTFSIENKSGWKLY